MPVLPALRVLERHHHRLANLTLHDLHGFSLAVRGHATSTIVRANFWTALAMVLHVSTMVSSHQCGTTSGRQSTTVFAMSCVVRVNACEYVVYVQACVNGERQRRKVWACRLPVSHCTRK